MATLLTGSSLEDAIATVDGWSGDASGIHRTVELADFTSAISLVNSVAAVAEEMDHHPDIDIRWATLTFTNATHSMGGVTNLDITLAGRINELVAAAR